MAFWGVEVRPGKPYTHVYDSSRGRLRVSQAALGDGRGAARSMLQCNVGDKTPILLCNLIPNVSETCHLELEFEEYDEVIFSVIGQRSVHLSGYYLGSGSNGGGDESDESYGEDIAETETDESDGYFDSDDDEYESDFINDNDIEMYPSQRKSNVVIEEIEDEKPANGNNGRRGIKKHDVSDSDEGVDSQCQLLVKSNNSMALESEDEDGFPISFSGKKKSAVKKAEVDGKSDDKMSLNDKKRKVDAISKDSESVRTLTEPLDSSPHIGSETNEKSKKKKRVKGKKALENDKVAYDEHKLAEGNVEYNGNDLPGVENGKYENGGKMKEQQKDKKGKPSVSASGVLDGSEMVDKADQAERKTFPNDNMDEDCPNKDELKKLPADEKVDDSLSLPPNTSPESSGKRKKKKKVKNNNSQETYGMATGEEGQRSTDKPNGNEIVDMNANAHSEPAVVDKNEDKKKNKKNKKHNNDPKNKDSTDLATRDKQEAQPQRMRTYGNGLVVEELSMGKPDGKRASPGKRVSVHYIGKLQNGKIFDSSVGKRPFKFRLGVGQVVKGWDVGINGMRVGDKRRLTIPPSMGYGNKNMGPIPGNSQLTFDVELVDVQ